MDLCNQSCLGGKSCKVGRYVQTFQPNFVIPAMTLTGEVEGGGGVVTKSVQGNLASLIAHLSTDQDEIYGVEAVQVEHSDTTFE